MVADQTFLVAVSNIGGFALAYLLIVKQGQKFDELAQAIRQAINEMRRNK